MPYRCEAKSLEGFIQQLAVAYVARGYRFYVTGFIPEGKDPLVVDAKLVQRYGVGLSIWARARRREKGEAAVQYLRHGRFFVLLATEGRHLLFEEESAVRDVRETPIRHGGYSVSSRVSTVTGKRHASVRIDREVYLGIKARLLAIASHRSVEALAAELHRLPFEPYAPVRRQFLNILRAVNRVRSKAGFEAVTPDCLRLRRRPVRPFEPAARRTEGGT